MPDLLKTIVAARRALAFHGHSPERRIMEADANLKVAHREATLKRLPATKTNPTDQQLNDFRGYLVNCTDAQVQGCYDKEKAAYAEQNDPGRLEYAQLAVIEADRRGITLDL